MAAWLCAGMNTILCKASRMQALSYMCEDSLTQFPSAEEDILDMIFSFSGTDLWVVCLFPSSAGLSHQDILTWPSEPRPMYPVSSARGWAPFSCGPTARLPILEHHACALQCLWEVCLTSSAPGPQNIVSPLQNILRASGRSI